MKTLWLSKNMKYSIDTHLYRGIGFYTTYKGATNYAIWREFTLGWISFCWADVDFSGEENE